MIKLGQNKLLAAAFLFGVALIGAGVWGALVQADLIGGGTMGSPGETLNLESMLYHIKSAPPGGQEEREYLGGYLGVYSIGVNWCEKMDINQTTGVLTCAADGTRQQNAYGILYDAFYSQEGNAVSEIHALIPVMKMSGSSYVLDYWLHIKLVDADSLQGHIWEHKPDMINLTTVNSTLKVGVESVLYNDTLFFDLFDV